MKLLLDTHTFIWWDNEPERLSDVVYDLISDPSNDVLLSVVSVWELAIKHQLGKIILASPLQELVRNQVTTNGFIILPVELPHVIIVETLPLHHRDPFDRLLVAQSMAENAALLSCDAVLDPYPVTRIW